MNSKFSSELHLNIHLHSKYLRRDIEAPAHKSDNEKECLPISPFVFIPKPWLTFTLVLLPTPIPPLVPRRPSPLHSKSHVLNRGQTLNNRFIVTNRIVFRREKEKNDTANIAIQANKKTLMPTAASPPTITGPMLNSTSGRPNSIACWFNWEVSGHKLLLLRLVFPTSVSTTSRYRWTLLGVK